MALRVFILLLIFALLIGSSIWLMNAVIFTPQPNPSPPPSARPDNKTLSGETGVLYLTRLGAEGENLKFALNAHDPADDKIISLSTLELPARAHSLQRQTATLFYLVGAPPNRALFTMDLRSKETKSIVSLDQGRHITSYFFTPDLFILDCSFDQDQKDCALKKIENNNIFTVLALKNVFRFSQSSKSIHAYYPENDSLIIVEVLSQEDTSSPSPPTITYYEIQLQTTKVRALNNYEFRSIQQKLQFQTNREPTCQKAFQKYQNSRQLNSQTNIFLGCIAQENLKLF